MGDSHYDAKRKQLDASRSRKKHPDSSSKNEKKSHHEPRGPRGAGVVRIQKQDDQMTRRIEITETMSTGKFYKKVIHAFHLHNPKEYGVYRGRNKTILIKPSGGKTLGTYKIKNGDMLFMFPVDEDLEGEWEDGEEGDDQTTVTSPLSPLSPGSNSGQNSSLQQQQAIVVEEEDLGPEAPDLTRLTMQDRAYLPFNDFLEDLAESNPSQQYPLETIRFCANVGCSQHETYPNNKCKKCNPSEICIEKQPYRHVDNIMFENQFVVERFVRTWRKTGFQRVGYMYGSYREHETIPNGVRAVVSAIYEPPQVCGASSIELLDDAKDNQVQLLANQLGLVRVGWIFTDLMQERENVIKCTRGKGEGSLLSVEECIMAADLQNRYPAACDKHKDGVFGSKFITVCVTGDTSNQIHFEAMQTSDQCAALVRDELITPMPGSPELAWIQESSDAAPLPDLYFVATGQDGIERKYNARPLPVDYLLVSVPAEFPLTQEFTFKVHDRKPFPIENRDDMCEVQDLETLNKYLCQFTNEEFLSAVSDFHLLIYFASMEQVPLWSNMNTLVDCVKNQDQDLADQWVQTSQWQQLLDLLNGLSLESNEVQPATSAIGPPPSDIQLPAPAPIIVLNEESLPLLQDDISPPKPANQSQYDTQSPATINSAQPTINNDSQKLRAT